MAIPLTARLPIPFTPPALLERNIAENKVRAEKGEPAADPISMMVRVPTMYERDAFTAQLVRGGVVHYSRKQIRELMLAGVTHLYPDGEFEQRQADLEELWQAADAYTECTMKRTDHYVELMEKQGALPPSKRMSEEDMEAELQAIQPSVVISDKVRVRTTAVQQDISARYEPLQKAFADLAEQDIRRSWICVEVYVTNFRGLEHTPEGNGRGGLQRREAEYLREHIGAEAFEQLAEFIFAMHSIDGDEEKNLASLIESSSALTGSTQAESMASNEAGSSEAEPSTSIPAVASRKTTDRSSSSSKPSETKTGRSRRTRTANPSSTSPSS